MICAYVSHPQSASAQNAERAARLPGLHRLTPKKADDRAENDLSRPVRRDVAHMARVLGTHVINMGPGKQVAAGARNRRATRSQSSIQRSD